MEVKILKKEHSVICGNLISNSYKLIMQQVHIQKETMDSLMDLRLKEFNGNKFL
jgi:DNA-directed RNA polymerase subunit N (RpoN/RPB10)